MQHHSLLMSIRIRASISPRQSFAFFMVDAFVIRLKRRDCQLGHLRGCVRCALNLSAESLQYTIKDFRFRGAFVGVRFRGVTSDVSEHQPTPQGHSRLAVEQVAAVLPARPKPAKLP